MTRNTASLTRGQQAASAAGETDLDLLYARIAGRFQRTEVRERARRYLAGLLDQVERKNGWQLARQLGERGPQGVQRLLNAAHWDAEAVRDDLRSYVVEQVGAPEGVLIVDDAGFVKKGAKSVGVDRQYSGISGRMENCQIGVFLAYASGGARAFLDRELYLPESWAADAARRTEAGVPPAVDYATRGQLARTMLERAFASAVPAAWVAGDEVYGNDGRLRLWLETQKHCYVLAVSCDQSLWIDGQQQRVDTHVATLPASAWQRRETAEAGRTPMPHEWAWDRLPYASDPGTAHWVLARRSLSDPVEVGYYRVYGPEEALLPEVVRVAETCWAVEEGFEQARNRVGLDHYEVRRWQAWYRHITLALLVHAHVEVTHAAAVRTSSGGDGKARRRYGR